MSAPVEPSSPRPSGAPPRKPERILVGLGNPGPEYADTRHNIGFRVLDHLAEQRGLLFRSARHFELPPEAASPTGRSPKLRGFSFAGESEPFRLVKPLTFMNASGDAVAPLTACLSLEPASVLVVYDELDLDLGRLRIRPHGGHGGHNGMRSLIDRIGSDRFPRLRVGIGRRSADAARHVLSPFEPGEQVEAEISVREAAEAALDWLESGDIEACMTRFHSRWSSDDSAR